MLALMTLGAWEGCTATVDSTQLPMSMAFQGPTDEAKIQPY
jgi:hypothetical protein